MFGPGHGCPEHLWTQHCRVEEAYAGTFILLQEARDGQAYMQQVHQPLGPHEVILGIWLPDEDPIVDALGHNEVPNPPHAVHVVEVHLDMHSTISTEGSTRGKVFPPGVQEAESGHEDAAERAPGRASW